MTVLLEVNLKKIKLNNPGRQKQKKVKFLVVGKASKATFQFTPGLKERTQDSPGLSVQWILIF